MKISASIVTYHTDAEELVQCIRCLIRNNVIDIWIADNSPEGVDTDAFAKRYFPGTSINLHYIHLPHNPGYGTAHNKAIQQAAGLGFNAHIVLNSDIKFDNDAVKRLADLLESDEHIGQISPKIVSPDGSQQYSQRLLPTPLDVFGRRFLPAFVMRSRNRRYMLTERNDNTSADIPYHQGSFMIFRMSALKEVGGFDERFFMYPEDIDITRRIHQNYITLYYPHVTVIHDHRAASYKNLRMLRIHCVNMIRYFNKWGWFFDSERRRFNRRTLREMHLTNSGKKAST